ncbi:MAG TPA: low-specificity L-threonine aldolase [Patescibacteria group bacterium]|nr:low-specificity L-threonine aldolase [Patescibacteria group bacterium]
MEWIDLRSDTVTMPTAAMREAMYQAEVGDDVYGEDPTVNALEALGARMTGKEAALFVTSGTMGNQIAIMASTNKGDEIICEAESHIFYYEVGGLACLAGVQARTLSGCRGILNTDQVRRAIRPQDIHLPKTSLLCLENTHNRAGGTIYSLDALQALQQVAKEHQVAVHMDGARIFNAAAALNVPVQAIAQYADSVMLCLAKGLCAPVGSLLVGSSEFIGQARRYRKMLGGGMRQAGILAAAGILALQEMPGRLPEDHQTARFLAEELVNMGMAVDLSTVQTNIVICDVTAAGQPVAGLVSRLREAGVRVNQFGESVIRLVTHQGIDRQTATRAVDILARCMKK